MQPRKQIAVFGSFLTNAESIEFEMAEELGYLLAQKGFQVICGGHGGIAIPLVSGVTRGGGVARGVVMEASIFPRRNAGMNPRITEIVQVDSLSGRLEMLADADGYVFFTGGIGTLAEFAFIWHSLQVAANFDRPVTLISRGWKPLLAKIKQEQMIKHKYYRIVHLCEQVKEAVAIVTKDYSLKYNDPCSLYYKETVFFDLDGTIVESPEEEFISAGENNGYFFSLPAVVDAYRKAGGLQYPPEGEASGRDDVSHKTAVLEHLGLDTRAAARVAEQVCCEHEEIPRQYADAPEILHYFKENGFSTGVYSSRPAWKLKEILSAHEMSGLFDVVLPPLNRSESHLDRSSFVEALERCGLQAKGLVHVGINLPECCHEPGATEVDSIVLDRHLAHIRKDSACKIRSLGELKYLVKHRALKG